MSSRRFFNDFRISVADGSSWIVSGLKSSLKILKKIYLWIVLAYLLRTCTPERGV